MSRAFELRTEPPSSELVIRRRALDDVPRIEAALRSLGYYEGTVEPELQGFDAGSPGPGGEPRTVLVAFRVVPGPAYRLGRPRVELAGGAPGYTAPDLATLGLKAGAPAGAQAVLDAEQALLRDARKRGRALARLGRRSTVLDPERRTLDVTLRLEPGPEARFGEVLLSGAAGVDEGYLRRRLPFKAGEPYDPDKVEAARRSLYETNLFSTVTVREADRLGRDGRMPIAFELKERAPRSVGVGAGYQTDVGPSARLFWEHRNLLGAGERLRAETELRADLRRVRTDLRKPDFLARDQALIGEVEGRVEDTDAFEGTSASAGLGVERTLRPGLVAGLGLAYRYAVIEEQGEEEETYGLVSVPARLDWDFSDDLLNPSRGGRLSLNAAPYVDTLGPSRQFFKTRLVHSRYLELASDPRLILALRGALGSTFGAERDRIPADERFYAGGGGSVRGVPFQLAGPLDDDDDPVGGRSLVELGAELRYRITDSLGAVLFLDGGSVFDSALPDFSEELSFGAGPGLRYFTPIGPLRLDLGFPLERRDGVDDLFQLYISLGQAF